MSSVHLWNMVETAGAETIVYQLVDNKLDKDLPLEWNRLTNRFLTTPKKMIVHDVHISVQQLVRNGFLEKSGNASRLIFGEKA